MVVVTNVDYLHCLSKLVCVFFFSEKGIDPVFYFYRGVHGIFTYKSPSFSLVLFAVS